MPLSVISRFTISSINLNICDSKKKMKGDDKVLAPNEINDGSSW